MLTRPPGLSCNCLLTHVQQRCTASLLRSDSGRRQDGVAEGDNEAAIFLTAPDNSGIKKQFRPSSKLEKGYFRQLSYERRTRSSHRMSDFRTLFWGENSSNTF